VSTYVRLVTNPAIVVGQELLAKVWNSFRINLGFLDLAPLTPPPPPSPSPFTCPMQFIPQGPSIGMLVLICIFSISFGYAWGPLGCLVPFEIQPLNTRSAGQSITVFTQLVLEPQSLKHSCSCSANGNGAPSSSVSTSLESWTAMLPAVVPPSGHPSLLLFLPAGAGMLFAVPLCTGLLACRYPGVQWESAGSGFEGCTSALPLLFCNMQMQISDDFFYASV